MNLIKDIIQASMVNRQLAAKFLSPTTDIRAITQSLMNPQWQ